MVPVTAPEAGGAALPPALPAGALAAGAEEPVLVADGPHATTTPDATATCRNRRREMS